MLDGDVDELFELREATIASNFSRISLLDRPRIEPLRRMFSAPVRSG